MLSIVPLKRKNLTRISLVLISILVCISVFLVNAKPSNAVVVPIIFPVVGSSSYSDDFNAPRSNGKHNATDIMAAKRQGVVAAADGVITYVAYPEPSWGYMVTINGNDGYTYNYIHINNDNPGTDDGKGGGMHAYAPDIERGNVIKKGQLIGWVGDSGNAESTAPHLHFEIYKGDTPINPYESLRKATKISKPIHHPQLANEYLPYGASTRLKANVAIGNLDSNIETQETVIAAGYGGGPHVKVADEQNRTVASFFAYDTNFRGGAEVDTGDIDGDGIDEIITGAGKGGGPHIRIFSHNGVLLKQFFAYSKEDRSGVRASIGDVDGDGKAEVVTVPLAGNAAPVKIFDLNGKELSSFYAYGDKYKDGHDIGVGDVNNDGTDEIVTGPGKGSGPHIRIFNGSGVRLQSYFVYDLDNRGGVRVAVGDITGNSADEIITAPDTYGGPHIKVLRNDGKHLRSDMFLESWWRSGYDVGAGKGQIKATAGEQRRTTVRSSL